MAVEPSGEGERTPAPRDLPSHIIEAHQFSGPLPPPEILRGYDDVVPGAAERILDMAEKEQRHRHRLEYSPVVTTRIGQVFGALLGAGGLYITYLLGMAGADLAALATVVGSLGLLAGAFFYNKRKGRAEASRE